MDLDLDGKKPPLLSGGFLFINFIKNFEDYDRASAPSSKKRGSCKL
jgi:hypothetical protein